MPNPHAPRPVRGRSSQSDKSNKGKWITAIVVLVLLLTGAAYAMMPGKDPAIAKIEALRQEMEGAPDERRREIWGEMREQYEQASPEAREQMRNEREARWMAEENKRLSDFFALSPQEQAKKLDESIKREEQWRKEREKRRAQRGGDGNRGGGGGDAGGRGDRGGRRSRGNSDDPNARRKSYLDKTSPQQRAMRGEYYRMRQERRQRMGLASR